MKLFQLFIITIFTLRLFCQTAILKGTITNPDGEVAPYVALEIIELKKGMETNEKGQFFFEALPAGHYTLKASFMGYKTLEKDLDLVDGNTIDIKLELLENTELLKEIIIKGYTSQNTRIASIAKLAIKPMDLPMAMQSIDKQTLENQQVLTMQDVLMNTNGVYIMGATGGYQEEIAARGFAMNSSNTFKNGVRFLNNMMPELSSLESVEVLKGSAAFLYGNVAAGGVLNLVTKKPKFENGGELGLRLGSFGLVKPTIDFYGAIGESNKIAYRLNGSWQKANSFRQHVSSERYYVNPSLLFKLNNKTELLIEGDYLDDRRTPDFGTGIINYEVIPDYPRNRFLGVTWGYADSKQLATSLIIKHTFSDKWRAALSATYRDAAQELFSNERPNRGVLIMADGEWIRNIARNENFDQYFITSYNLIGSLKTGALDHNFLIGFDAEKLDFQTQNYTNLNGYDAVNIFSNLSSSVRSDIPTLNKNTFVNSSTNRYGIYLQDFFSLKSYIKFLAGLRYSSQNNTNIVTATDGKESTTLAPAEGSFSPRLGLVIQPKKCHSLFASYANSFLLNTGVDIEGKALPPSIVNQYEVGLKNEVLDGKASINLTVYQIDNNNLAQMSLANGNTNSNIKELAGYVRSKGLELDLSARPIANLQFMMGYSYNQTKFIKSNTFIEGSFLKYNPNHTANVSINYTQVNGRLNGFSLGLTTSYIGLRYAGRSTRVQVQNDAYRITPIEAYTQCDFTIAYTIRSITMRAKVANLFDVNSYNVHDDNSINPIAPRNYSVSTAIKF